jgi:tetratricopeptide (TPR) repeat protein
VHYLQSQVYNRLNQLDKAAQHAHKFIELLGDDAEVYHELGQANQRLQRFPEAIEAYRKGLDDDPDHVGNLTGLCRSILADPVEKLSADRKKGPGAAHCRVDPTERTDRENSAVIPLQQGKCGTG